MNKKIVVKQIKEIMELLEIEFQEYGLLENTNTNNYSEKQWFDFIVYMGSQTAYKWDNTTIMQVAELLVTNKGGE